jgi:uncharacterized LabA/DUF88 family protein
MRPRVWALFDGFNWYYAIKDAMRGGLCGAEKKWLDYREMANRIVAKELGTQDFDLDVRCYTAFVRGDQRAADRHRWYLRALAAHEVTVVKGNYKKKQVRCRAQCKKKFDSWEEKATDVNMAIDIVAGGALDEYDALFLFSGDSDLAPALHKAKQTAPLKTFHVIVPGWRRGMKGNQHAHQELDKRSDNLVRLNFCDFGPELPDRVTLPNGKIAHRPAQWK